MSQMCWSRPRSLGSIRLKLRIGTSSESSSNNRIHDEEKDIVISQEADIPPKKADFRTRRKLWEVR